MPKKETINPEDVEVGDIIAHPEGHEGLVLDLYQGGMVAKVFALSLPDVRVLRQASTGSIRYWTLSGFTVKVKPERGE
jgi:hypothetical protein